MRQILKVPVWPTWIMLAVSVFMTAEYSRLVLTTDAATYRYFVLSFWVLVLAAFVVSAVRHRRDNQ